MSADPDDTFLRSLIEEAGKKSSLLWLRAPGDEYAAPLWHVVVEGAIHLVGEGREQPLPVTDDGATVEVTLRSKDTGGRILRFTATAHRVAPGSEAWDEVVPVLHANRLSPLDGEAQPARWADESVVLRLEPTGAVAESPGRLSTRSHAAPPPPSPATTRGPLPFVLGRRARRRR